MLKKILPIAVTFVITTILVTFATINSQTTATEEDPGLPYINDNGNWSPEYFDVSDSTGTTVGVVKTADAFADDIKFPLPVFSSTDRALQVGHYGEYGYWALGEPEPWCESCKLTKTEYKNDGSKRIVTEQPGPNYTITRTTETLDPDGNKTSSEVEVIHHATPTPTPTQ